MKRHAIFVDAGYVFAQGAVSLLGSNSKRTQLKLNEAEIIAQLKNLATIQSPGVQLLRIYWYDGARNGPTLDHLALANMRDVKLRLGSVNSLGQQKEVDSLLVTDLIDLARNQSICDATLVAADSDLRVAVQIAQSFGVRVHLVGLEPSRVSQSPSLRQEADTVDEIRKADVAKFLSIVNPIPPQLGPVDPHRMPTAVPSELDPVQKHGPIWETETSAAKDGEVPTLAEILQDAIDRTLAPMLAEDVARLAEELGASNSIPKEYDRRLLGTCRTLLGRDLTGDERREMRNAFAHHLVKSQVPR